MRAFNFEEAQQGYAVRTRDGREARIVCFDVCNTIYPIMALLKDAKTGNEFAQSYTIYGKCLTNGETPDDLLMAPIIRERWVRLDPAHGYEICLDKYYPTEEEARENIRKGIIVAHIEWEEDE